MLQNQRRARFVIAAVVGLGIAGVAVEASADSKKPDSPSHNAPGRNRGRTAVPEIPVGGASAALALLLGGTAIALDRRKRRAQ